MPIPRQLARSLGGIQRQRGTTRRDGQFQVLRKQFYSFIPYPLAGAALFTFFGNTLATTGVNRQLTNIPKAGSFGTNHFRVKAISTDYFLNDFGLASYASTDATTVMSDLLYGFADAGVLEFNIGARNLLQIPVPFLQCPPANGGATVDSAGIGAAGISPPPHADMQRKSQNRWLAQPEIIIEAEQQFEVKISYPSGAIPILATGVINGTTNQLYIGIVLDGLIYRPLQ